MEPHPLAERIPPMSTDEYVSLRESVRENGLLHAIITYEGKVLDGRNRLRACEETDTEPHFRPYEGDSPATFVLSTNVHRRHLSVSQRAMVAADFLPEYEDEASRRKAHGLTSPGHPNAPGKDAPSVRSRRAREDAAEVMKVSPRSVQTAKRVKEKDPELADQVVTGAITLGAADRQIREREPERQAEIAAQTVMDDIVREVEKDRIVMIVRQSLAGLEMLENPEDRERLVAELRRLPLGPERTLYDTRIVNALRNLAAVHDLLSTRTLGVAQ